MVKVISLKKYSLILLVIILVFSSSLYTFGQAFIDTGDLCGAFLMLEAPPPDTVGARFFGANEEIFDMTWEEVMIMRDTGEGYVPEIGDRSACLTEAVVETVSEPVADEVGDVSIEEKEEVERGEESVDVPPSPKLTPRKAKERSTPPAPVVETRRDEIKKSVTTPTIETKKSIPQEPIVKEDEEKQSPLKKLLKNLKGWFKKKFGFLAAAPAAQPSNATPPTAPTSGPTAPNPEIICNDNLDNDGDSAVDCADSDCQFSTACRTHPTVPTPPTAPAQPTSPQAPTPPTAGTPTAPTPTTGPTGPTAPATNPTTPTSPASPVPSASGPAPSIPAITPTIPLGACGTQCYSTSPCPSGLTCSSYPQTLGTGICTSTSCPENSQGTCSDQIDNDQDGVIDCSDQTCFGIGICTREYANNWPGWYWRIPTCRDNLDNDNDKLIDCLDPDCAWACDEHGSGACRDGIDNNMNGLIDFNDPGCAVWWSESFGGNCGIGSIDEDTDGLRNCADITDCGKHPLCSEGLGSGVKLVGPDVGLGGGCFDNVDNDGDNLTDCADSDCINSGACSEQGNCFDNHDNDADGLVDCFDTGDCSTDAACKCTETDPAGNFLIFGTVNLPSGASARNAFGGTFGGLASQAADMCLPTRWGATPNTLIEFTCPASLYSGPTVIQTVCSGACVNGAC